MWEKINKKEFPIFQDKHVAMVKSPTNIPNLNCVLRIGNEANFNQIKNFYLEKNFSIISELDVNYNADKDPIFETEITEMYLTCNNIKPQTLAKEQDINIIEIKNIEQLTLWCNLLEKIFSLNSFELQTFMKPLLSCKESTLLDMLKME